MASETNIVPVSASEATANNVVPLPHRPEPVTPSEKALTFVKEHPVLTVAGGLAAGLVISALIPRSFSRRLAKRAFRLAETGAATALTFGQDALDKAEDGGAVARKKAALLADRAERLGDRAAARAEKLADKAAVRAEKAFARAEKLGVAALGTAGAWGHAAADRAEHLGHAAAARAEGLGERASDRLSQLGDKALVQSNKLLGHGGSPSAVTDRILDKAHGIKARFRG